MQEKEQIYPLDATITAFWLFFFFFSSIVLTNKKVRLAQVFLLPKTAVKYTAVNTHRTSCICKNMNFLKHFTPHCPIIAFHGSSFGLPLKANFIKKAVWLVKVV